MFSSQQQSFDRFRAAHISHLRHLAIFAVVVESGSFTTAARRLGIAKSGVSRHISELETYVGAQLLNRTTRSNSLTEAGKLMFQDCAGLVNAAIGAFDKLDPDLPLNGTLKIAATIEHGQYVLPPIVSKFLARHPDMDIELELGDRFIDLVDNGIDLALRVGSPGPSPQYISKKVGEFRYRLFASKALIEKNHPMLTPQDVEKIPWLLSASGTSAASWTFEKAGELMQVEATGRAITNSISARIEMAKYGAGLVAIPDFIPTSTLGKSMCEILSDFTIVPNYPIYAVYPNAQFLSPRVVDFLQLLQSER